MCGLLSLTPVASPTCVAIAQDGGLEGNSDLTSCDSMPAAQAAVSCAPLSAAVGQDGLSAILNPDFMRGKIDNGDACMAYVLGLGVTVETGVQACATRMVILKEVERQEALQHPQALRAGRARRAGRRKRPLRRPHLHRLILARPVLANRSLRSPAPLRLRRYADRCRSWRLRPRRCCSRGITTGPRPPR